VGKWPPWLQLICLLDPGMAALAQGLETLAAYRLLDVETWSMGICAAFMPQVGG
jgi:hypothetical protein